MTSVVPDALFVIAAYVATFRVAIIVELVAWAFSLAAASFFPALVMGIWWKRTNKAGALAGMISGLAVTLFYMIGSRFYGVSWFGTATVASATTPRSWADPRASAATRSWWWASSVAARPRKACGATSAWRTPRGTGKRAESWSSPIASTAR